MADVNFEHSDTELGVISAPAPAVTPHRSPRVTPQGVTPGHPGGHPPLLIVSPLSRPVVLWIMAPSGKATSAYFVFCDENRAAEKEKILAELGEGAKVSVADVAKALGQKWKTVSEEEKQRFKEVAQKKTEEKAEELKLRKEQGLDAAEEGEEDNGPAKKAASECLLAY
eukprot:gene29001-32194_t